MTEQQLKNIEFCKYLQPIVSGCSGFIRTEGYMYHFPGHVIMMSFDESSDVRIIHVFHYDI